MPMRSAAVAEPDRSAMRANDPAISPAGRLLMMLPDRAAPIPLVQSTAVSDKPRIICASS